MVLSASHARGFWHSSFHCAHPLRPALRVAPPFSRFLREGGKASLPAALPLLCSHNPHAARLWGPAQPALVIATLEMLPRSARSARRRIVQSIQTARDAP